MFQEGHDWIRGHTEPMHCETCGLTADRCPCGAELHVLRCLGCGFRLLTGGRSIGEMLAEMDGKPN